MKKIYLLAIFLGLASVAHAHEGHSHAPLTAMQSRIVELNTQPKVWLTSSGRVMRNTDDRPDIADHFKPFANPKNKLNKVDVRWDKQFLYVESRGMPDHEMMTGITAWQQQVPLPQNYTGDNAWRIPLKPVPAKKPMSAKDHFFRGAIALAVNGVPIFNPIKNDGRTDTLKAGELDQWGGHCGRGDDYHYHIGPVHLEKIVGKGNPIGVALDGYLLYGYEDPKNLDWLNGQKEENGVYHYHSTKTYPYINGGFYGEVVERGGQVDPQPRAQGIRPAMPPLRGAKIKGFENPEPGNYVVRYEVRGEKRSVEYTVAENGSAKFQFVSPQGTKTENYSPRPRRGGGRQNADRPGGNQPLGDRGGKRSGGRNQRMNEQKDDPQKGDRNRKGAQGQDRQRGGGDRGKGQSGGGSRLGGYETPPPANNVPKHDFDILLGRPTDQSITASILFYHDANAVIYYGTNPDNLSSKTEAFKAVAGEPVELDIDDLEPSTSYSYQLKYRIGDESKTKTSGVHFFHTQRASTRSFRFTVQADSHLDENTSGEVYLRTLRNALRDGPDFHVALGDTFMTGKYVRPDLAEPQYLAQRYYLGSLCHSTPLFFCLGNHDGESNISRRGKNTRGSPQQNSDPNPTRTWSVSTRKKYIPNPFPDLENKNSFYSGNRDVVKSIGQVENYYAWHWGNSLFVVLDPFWYSQAKPKTNDDHWHQTLGDDQYHWLTNTLSTSDAKYKFVFIHHLVGGADRNNRGGVASAPYFEWGGKELDGTSTFAKNRPNWEMPIHDLLVKHDVSIVFHGHDHLYAKEELDGIIYQAVPQPGHLRFGKVRSAQEYGYAGEVISSSGHLRVSVASDSARVDYVRAYLPKDETSRRSNGEISSSYLVNE